MTVTYTYMSYLKLPLAEGLCRYMYKYIHVYIYCIFYSLYNYNNSYDGNIHLYDLLQVSVG